MRCRRGVFLPIVIVVAVGLALPTAAAGSTRAPVVHPSHTGSTSHTSPAALAAMKVPQAALGAAQAPQGIAPPARGVASLHGLRRIDATTSRQNADKIGNLYGSGPIYATPPSPTLGVGPTRVIEAVNGSVSYYDRTTGGGLNRESLDVFAGYAGNEIASSPQVFYDVRSARWFVTVAFTEYDNAKAFIGSRVVILVSKNNAPSSMADFVAHDVSSTTAAILDEPLLIVTSDKVVVRTNSFDSSTLAPVGTDLLIMNLSGLVPADPNNPPPLAIADNSLSIPHEGMAVASSYGSAAGDAAAYLTYWQTSGSSPTANLGVIGITGTTIPYTVTDSTVPVPVGGAPVPPTDVAALAPASTGTVPIYGGDFQPVSAVARGPVLWSASIVTCTPDGDSTARSCVRLVGTTTGTTPTLSVDETYSRLGSNLWAPAITLDSTSQVHLTANLLDAGSTVGVIHDVRAADGSWLAAPLVRWSGATYHPLTGVDDVASGATSLFWSARAAVVPDPDPTSTDVWTAAQTVAPYAAATYPDGGNWADSVWRVGAGRSVSAAALTRTPPVVTYGGWSKLASAVYVSGTGVGRNWPVRLESRAHGIGAYVPAAYSNSTTAGAFAYMVRPALNTDYRIAVLDPVTGAPWAYSGAAVVSVKWSATVKASATKRLHGSKITFTGKVSPTTRMTVYLQRLYKGRWYGAGSAKTNSASVYGVSAVLAKGLWYYRLYAPAYANHLAAYSVSVRVTGT